jgi:hypothetical protein
MDMDVVIFALPSSVAESPQPITRLAAQAKRRIRRAVSQFQVECPGLKSRVSYLLSGTAFSVERFQCGGVGIREFPALRCRLDAHHLAVFVCVYVPILHVLSRA